MNYSEIVGRRILVEYDNVMRTEIHEFLVLEVSPSKENIKTKNIHGHVCWQTIKNFKKDFKFLEVLNDYHEGVTVTTDFVPIPYPFDLYKTVSSNSSNASIESSFTFKESDWKKQI